MRNATSEHIPRPSVVLLWFFLGWPVPQQRSHNSVRP